MNTLIVHLYTFKYCLRLRKPIYFVNTTPSVSRSSVLVGLCVRRRGDHRHHHADGQLSVAEGGADESCKKFAIGMMLKLDL